MGKKKEVIRLVPFTLREVSTFNKLKTAMELPYIFNAVSNNKDAYSHIRVKNNEAFDKTMIDLIIKEFQKTYTDANLVFEQNGKNGEFYVGNFQKIAD